MKANEILPADLIRRISEDKSCLVVDVRTPEEFASRFLAGSINIPLDQLQGAVIHDLEAKAQGKSLFLLCGMGKRAHMARQNIEAVLECKPIVVSGGISAMLAQGAELSSSTEPDNE